MIHFVCPLALNSFGPATGLGVEQLSATTNHSALAKQFLHAGLSHAKVLTQRKDAARVQSALAHEQWLRTQLGQDRCDQANALLALKSNRQKVPKSLTQARDAPNTDIPRRFWLVRPVVLQLGLDHLVLSPQDPGSLALSHPEVWMQAINEALEPSWTLQALEQASQAKGTQEQVPSDTLFVLSTPKNVDWEACSSMQAMGRSIELYLPKGKSASQWRKFLNMSQMLLHEHALNEERQRAGLSSINGFWLEGEVAVDRFDQLEVSTIKSISAPELFRQAQALPLNEDLIVVLTDWISPAHQSDLSTWQAVWQRWAALVRPLHRSRVQWHFFGESSELSLESTPQDRWFVWRHQVARALKQIAA